MGNGHQLFRENEWAVVASQQRRLLESEISGMDENSLLNSSVDDLSNYFAEKYKFNVPVLLREQIVVTQRETQIDISRGRDRYADERNRPFTVTGTVVEAIVPFAGIGACFNIKPTSFSFNAPEAELQDDSLRLTIEGVNLTLVMVRTHFLQILADITQNLNYLRTDVEKFNGGLFTHAHNLIVQRRRKLLNERNLVFALELALRERRQDAEADPISEAKQKLTPFFAPAPSFPFKPEPALSIDDYERVLLIIKNVARLLKFSPSIVATMDEEALRLHTLIHLNAQFEGKTTGEIFSREGKSAIVLRAEGKNVFAAECTFWSNSQALTETLERMLGDKSWRQAKLTLLLVNRDPGFTQALDLMRKTLIGHSSFKRELPQLSATSFAYVFAHREDRNREMLLTLLACDIPNVELQAK